MSARGDSAPSIHASAVLVGDTGILIRGPSGAGKSQLAFELMLAGRSGQTARAILVGDDRVHVSRDGDRLLARPAANLAGLIEIRGLGIRACDFVAEAAIGLVVDLDAADAERLPGPAAARTEICGLGLPRLPVGTGYRALPLVLATLVTAPVQGADSAANQRLSDDCRQGFGNHIRPIIATK